jgi:hypothetical protein
MWRPRCVSAVLSDKEMDEILEYEMDDEDFDWLTKELPDKKLQIKEDKFEQIMDRLEKESFKQVCVIRDERRLQKTPPAQEGVVA